MHLKKKHIMPKISLPLLILIIFALLGSCEKQVPLSAFDFDYAPEYQIEGDFYPQNLGKSILRINHTFTIEDSMSLEQSYVTDADARLFGPDGLLLSTMSWHDSATGYQYVNIDEQVDPNIPLDSISIYLDTLIYGGYQLDRVDFQMEANTEYQLRVEIGDETFQTSFSPYPLVDFLPFATDSIVPCNCEYGLGDYERIYATMSSDTARLRWPEDPNAYLYTVVTEQVDSDLELGAQAFAFPGPVLNFGALPGTYKIIIGSMDQRFYEHYYLSDYPPNHPNRNFFGGKALGYAGAINERYLTIRIVPPGSQ